MDQEQSVDMFAVMLPRLTPRVVIPPLGPQDFKKWFQGEAIKCAERIYLDRHVTTEWQYKLLTTAHDYAEAIAEPKRVYGEGGILVDIVYNEQWKKVVEAFVKIVSDTTAHKVREHHIL